MILIPSLSLIYNFVVNSTEILWSFSAQLFLYSALWFIGLLKNDASIIDFAWGLGIFFQGFIYWYKTNNLHIHQTIFSMLVMLHGLRLTWFMLRRKVANPAEDKRWGLIKEKFGKSFWFLNFFTLCLPMLFANLLIGFSIFAFEIAKNQSINHFKFFIGLFMMLGGFGIQSLADEQKFAFHQNSANKDKICNIGLWKLSRHPNYFGDALFWWGVYMVNMSADVHITFFAPLLYTIIVRFITGVPLAEYFMKKDFKTQFADYQTNTPIFIPWIPADVNIGQTFGKGIGNIAGGNSNQNTAKAGGK